MYSDNPLCLVLLSILKDTENKISLYELMSSIEGAGYVLVENSELLSSELKLFRKNFVVMNALYQLQKDLKDTGFYLHISSLSIILMPFAEKSINGLPAEVEADDMADEKLSEYYLDWNNYHSVDQQGVQNLLNSFWKQYTEYNVNHHDKRLDALRILGLESDASWENIQQTYRCKIANAHPDKGGSSLKFIEIREAFQILKLLKHKKH